MGWESSRRHRVRRLRLVRPLAGAQHAVARLLVGGAAVRCVIGASGVVRAKREGDGGTPAGRFRILSGFYRSDRVRRSAYIGGMQAIRPEDGWCDDPASQRYNTHVRLPQKARCENMTLEAPSYDFVFVLDYNLRPRRLGRGSAIFFHLAHSDWTPTAGCIAISLSDMRKIVPRLAREAVIEIA